MSEWAESSAEEIRQQAGTPQEKKIVIGPVVFDGPVQIDGDLTIISD